MNVKLKLIHFLGGVTTEEVKDRQNYTYFLGQRAATQDIKNYAESLNGTNADDWCKNVYNYIVSRLESIDNTKELNDVEDTETK